MERAFLREVAPINHQISNRRPGLKAQILGREGGSLSAFRTDGQGRLLLAPGLAVPAAADGLDIRPLTPARDSLLIGGAGIDIRPLEGGTDSLARSQGRTAFAQASGSLIIGAQYFLPRDISPYRTNIYRVQLTGVSALAYVQLQIAPVDNGDYYVPDGGEFELLGGGVVFLQPTRLARYARVRVSALLSLGTITVHYFGRA